MAHKPVCLVCQKEMVKGFISDSTQGVYELPRWSAGEPHGNFWSGEVAKSQVDKGLKVTAYRCPECHALRLYAFDAE
ncbi:MAG: PF20097 family protein [Phycisphaerales bacterium]